VDNIVVSHTAGIERLGGAAFENFNLFFGNTSNLSGTITSGSSSLPGNPQFVLPAADNYHLRANSPAIDHGADVLIVEDFDGQTRPFGPGFDIGFDEFTGAVILPRVFMPFVLNQ
jgi:hypothetical protein